MKNSRRVVARGGFGGDCEMGEGVQNVQTSSYKKISPENVMYSMVTIVNSHVLHI